jgi:predicted RNA-binding protein with PIN domain
MHYLVDGYSVIHARPDLKKALGKRLAHARELLIQRLQQYQDHAGERVTLFFDGRSGPEPKPPAKRKKSAGPESPIEVVFSSEGQSADMLIEQRVGKSTAPSQYLVVTADHAIENTVGALGASISPDSFFELIGRAEKEFGEWLDEHRSRTKRKFSQG